MSLVRQALRACLSDLPFVESELLAELRRSSVLPALGKGVELRLVDVEDREAVIAELRVGRRAPLVLSAFADVEDAAHAYRVAQALWDAGFDERTKYRIPRPLALIEADGLVVSEGAAGIPLVKLVDRRAAETVRQVKEAGAWLGRLHSALVREGRPWFPWRTVEVLSTHIRARRRVVEAHRDDIRAMVNRLASAAERSAPQMLVQTHGRFRPDRVMAAPGVVTVEDLVRSAPGDPARDIAEFAFHIRRRAVLAGDPRASVLEPAFLQGYLAEAPDEHLDNVGFYAGCAVLTSLVADAPLEGDLRDWVEFHLEEFDRWVLPAPIEILLPGA
jgi:hypothetical protein